MEPYFILSPCTTLDDVALLKIMKWNLPLEMEPETIPCAPRNEYEF